MSLSFHDPVSIEYTSILHVHVYFRHMSITSITISWWLVSSVYTCVLYLCQGLGILLSLGEFVAIVLLVSLSALNFFSSVLSTLSLRSEYCNTPMLQTYCTVYNHCITNNSQMAVLVYFILISNSNYRDVIYACPTLVLQNILSS